MQHPDEARTFCPWRMRHRIQPRLALETLHLARSLRLKEPKNRIYALMALRTLDNAMPTVQPKYRKNVGKLDVYLEFAIKYLENTRDLDILRFVEHKEDIGTCCCCRRPFPSWVPRWNSEHFVSQIVDGACRKITCIEGQHGNFRDYSLSSLEGRPVLRVRAIIVDSVRYVSKTIEDHYEAPERAVTQVISLWRSLEQQLEKYPGPHGKTPSLAFLVALQLGQYSGEEEEHDRNLHEFAQHLQSKQPSQPSEAHTGMNAQDASAQAVSILAADKSRNRRFILLGRGYHGISPETARKGDHCAIIFGTRTPFMRRRASSK